VGSQALFQGDARQFPPLADPEGPPIDAAARAAVRRGVLLRLGGEADAVAEVFAYCESPFHRVQVPKPVFPLPPEPHVADWRRYLAEAGPHAFAYLQERLPQLVIPVREGISKTAAYADATLRGVPVRSEDLGGRLHLERPAQVRLFVHEHPAGALPVIVVAHRGDFETLVRALAWRGEPRPLSPAVNAQIVTGFNNWERLRRHRADWMASVDPAMAERVWPAELARVADSEPWRFRDCFVITCLRPYSGVAAGELGLEMDEADWLERSTLLRVEHEFTHYATQRVFGAMSLNLLDETLADFMGTTYALGTFRAAWYLRFLGLENWPQVREHGRVLTYAAALSPPAVRLLCALVVRAAHGLEDLATRWYDPAARGRFLLALASLTLELLSAEEAPSLFADAYDAAGALLGAGG
jgi:hypothetical protein